MFAVRAARDGDAGDIDQPELAFSKSIAGDVARRGRSALFSDVHGDGQLPDSSSIADLQLRSVLCVPMRVGERVVGSLYVDDSSRAAAFDDRLYRFAGWFAKVALLKFRKRLEHQQRFDLAGLLDALEAGFTRWELRRHDGTVHAPIDEWREYVALRAAYEAAVAAGGLELRRLRHYVASFGGASKKRPDPETIASIKKRIATNAATKAATLLIRIERASSRVRGSRASSNL